MKQLVKISLFVFLGMGLWAFSRADQLFDLAKNLDIYASVIKELNQFYVDPIDPNKVVQNSIDGMLDQLDPYTVYYPEEDLDEFTTLTTGKYEGIGIRASWVDKGYYITYVDESSPALQAGLQIGDQLLSINGNKITEESDPGLLIKGPKDSKLVAEIKRGDSQLTLSINRSTVQIKNVGYAGIIRPGIGYIELEEFNQSATKEMKAALVQLKKEGMKKLILDLRNNPGGLLTQAVDICNLFLDKEKPIVSTKGKLKEWNATYKALNPSWDTSMPIVVLINQTPLPPPKLWRVFYRIMIGRPLWDNVVLEKASFKLLVIYLTAQKSKLPRRNIISQAVAAFKPSIILETMTPQNRSSKPATAEKSMQVVASNRMF